MSVKNQHTSRNDSMLSQNTGKGAACEADVCNINNVNNRRFVLPDLRKLLLVDEI